LKKNIFYFYLFNLTQYVYQLQNAPRPKVQDTFATRQSNIVVYSIFQILSKKIGKLQKNDFLCGLIN